MLLYFDSGEQIRGDLVLSAGLRSDLVPIPLTLELDVRADDSVIEQLHEGRIISTGQGDRLRIVYSKPVRGNTVRGDQLEAGVRVVAFLDECAPASHVRERAIIESRQTLNTIYRAAGCKLKPMVGDITVPRFVCLAGDTPTFHIARAAQEAGGVLRWKDGRLQFLRIQDLLRQKPAISLPNTASDDVQSGFLERHQVPAFFSVAPDGSIVHGNRTKARSVVFAPHQNVAGLHNMTRVLIKRKEVKTDYAGHLCAGDVVDFVGSDPMVIITAGHFSASGSDAGGAQQAFTKLWCGVPM